MVRILARISACIGGWIFVAGFFAGLLVGPGIRPETSIVAGAALATVLGLLVFGTWNWNHKPSPKKETNE